MTSRSVRKVTESVEQSEGEGDGTTIKRCLGDDVSDIVDPFLMLDEFTVNPPTGFPDHPHRGFELVSYILKGTGQHEDFMGNKGKLKTGDVQWLTAGRGIVHCEWSYGEEKAHGLQLWINLAKDQKMQEPSCQEMLAEDIPRTSKEGIEVKVIAGEAFGIKSTIRTRTPTLYLHFTMNEGTTLNQPIPKGWNAFVHVLSGKALFGPESKEKLVIPTQTAILNAKGDCVIAQNQGSDPCSFILLAGQPLNEPVAQQGPFVMNTEEELHQALEDYKSCINGFERANSWQSNFQQSNS
ncbi:pirin-like [Saccostrea cucullata]|uniref:pirin-like n=1 Tax=Saccostrea cuccullata TaxID=36930 RepID=UPI002ED543EE